MLFEYDINNWVAFMTGTCREISTIELAINGIRHTITNKKQVDVLPSKNQALCVS